ncbi:arylsulfatase [Oleiharenicola lentus]|uniref:Arylsulfatase n=1 Tax=Oleiharenicola lentus TaxID=2508720 RepID=A0A4Q1CBD7_9BACT|nr:arylsulfatase [Oleiharenicola lentus]RXK56415.1 arylsulfatase [Oleiharenicola lentus]
MKALLTALSTCALLGAFLTAAESPSRPNIVLIMADDMGYSDIGCYGSEIPTPNLDALAAHGLRFSQFYNTARCSPTRAALLTGLNPHQAGMGTLAEDPGKQAKPDAAAGYQEYLNDRCVTLAEALRPAGYRTLMSGKWHLGYHGENKWPLARGFDRFYGIISGASSYFSPKGARGLTLDNTPLPTPADPTYYTTDAFTDHALQFLRESPADRPFFLYLAFTAPHWPLHARAEDIEKFRGKYRGGWDNLRAARFERQKQLGLIPTDTVLSPRDDGARAWNELSIEQQEQLDYRMAVYAAQVHRMDHNIGRLVEHLRTTGKLENTVILFLSDNGGCAEPYTDLGGGAFSAINKPSAGGPGNKNAEGDGGSAYGTGWANASNTPFRRYKSRLHEGGISTPLIVHWPAGLKAKPGSINSAPGYLTDIMPTALELARATYPAKTRSGEAPYALVGRSLCPAIAAQPFPDQTRWLFWEQYNNKAVRHGDWKAVQPAESNGPWELYDLSRDRTELHDLAISEPARIAKMTAAWQQWAETHQVLPKKRP